EDALVIDDHCLKRPSHNDQLLIEVVAGHRDAFSHQELTPRATEPDKVDTLCSVLPCESHELGVGNCLDYHLGEHRVVAVDRDVDVVFFEHRKVDPGFPDGRSAEQDIGDIGAKHRPTPAVGEAAAQALQQDVNVIRTHPHLDPVHAVHHLSVDPPWGDPEFVPDFTGCFRGPVEELEGVFCHAVLFEHGTSKFGSKSLVIFAFDCDAVFLCKQPQLLGVGDAVVFGFSHPHEIQCLNDVTAVVGMGRGPGGYRVKQVAGNDQVCVGTADAADAVGRDDPAWSHGTPGAGKPRLAVLTGWLLHLVPVPDRLEALLHRYFKEGLGILVDRALLFLLLDERRIHQGHPGPVQLTDIEPFPDEYGFWFLLRHFTHSIGISITGNFPRGV